MPQRKEKIGENAEKVLKLWNEGQKWTNRDNDLVRSYADEIYLVLQEVETVLKRVSGELRLEINTFKFELQELIPEQRTRKRNLLMIELLAGTVKHARDALFKIAKNVPGFRKDLQNVSDTFEQIGQQKIASLSLELGAILNKYEDTTSVAYQRTLQILEEVEWNLQNLYSDKSSVLNTYEQYDEVFSNEEVHAALLPLGNPEIEELISLLEEFNAELKQFGKHSVSLGKSVKEELIQKSVHLWERDVVKKERDDLLKAGGGVLFAGLAGAAAFSLHSKASDPEQSRSQERGSLEIAMERKEKLFKAAQSLESAQAEFDQFLQDFQIDAENLGKLSAGKFWISGSQLQKILLLIESLNLKSIVFHQKLLESFGSLRDIDPQFSSFLLRISRQSASIFNGFLWIVDEAESTIEGLQRGQSRFIWKSEVRRKLIPLSLKNGFFMKTFMRLQETIGEGLDEMKEALVAAERQELETIVKVLFLEEEFAKGRVLPGEEEANRNSLVSVFRFLLESFKTRKEVVFQNRNTLKKEIRNLKLELRQLSKVEDESERKKSFFKTLDAMQIILNKSLEDSPQTAVQDLHFFPFFKSFKMDKDFLESTQESLNKLRADGEESETNLRIMKRCIRDLEAKNIEVAMTENESFLESLKLFELVKKTAFSSLGLQSASGTISSLEETKVSSTDQEKCSDFGKEIGNLICSAPFQVQAYMFLGRKKTLLQKEIEPAFVLGMTVNR